MAHNVIIGGGLAGCTIGRELAENGQDVTIIEKANGIGGKVRHYGCKATEQCNNCGLCLAGDLWESVKSHQKIKILTATQLKDILGSRGDFQVIVTSEKGIETLDGIANIVVSTGFEDSSPALSGNLEINMGSNLISGSEMEKVLSKRKRNGIFDEELKKVAFIQCFGSRDIQQHNPYCSRVCCAYSTRMARVIKHFYAEAEVTFFYMDLQKVEEGEYFSYLTGEQNMQFVKCRPVKIKGGKPGSVLYEQPGKQGVKEKEFDLIILSEGIYPSQDNEKLAELCMLGLDKNGFLKCVKDGSISGVYLAGCATGPKRIEEVYTESLKVAQQLMKY